MNNDNTFSGADGNSSGGGKNGPSGLRLLVTGSRGFLGRRLTKVARQRGHFCVELDYTLGHDINRPMMPDKIDAVIHLAAVLKSHSASLFNYLYWVNVRGTVNMLDISIKQKIPKFIFMSSAGVYDCMGVYGASKLAGEAFCRGVSDQIQTKIFRLFNAYGPGQSAKSGALVPNTLNALFHKQDIVVHGDGSQTRDFIFVEDVITAIITEVEKDIMPCAVPVDLGTGTQTSVLEMVDILRGAYVNIKGEAELTSTVNLVPCMGRQSLASQANVTQITRALISQPTPLVKGAELTALFWHNFVCDGHSRQFAGA